MTHPPYPPTPFCEPAARFAWQPSLLVWPGLSLPFATNLHHAPGAPWLAALPMNAAIWLPWCGLTPTILACLRRRRFDADRRLSDGAGLRPDHRKGIGLTNTKAKLRVLYIASGEATVVLDGKSGTISMMKLPCRMIAP